MQKKKICFLVCYICLMIGAYIFPLFAHFIYTFFALMQLDILSMLAAFAGSFIVGAMVFFPFFCVYYAALAFIHTLLDEILILRSSPKLLSFPFILVSFVSSAFLALNSILTIEYFEHDLGWIPLILMILGAVIGGFLHMVLLSARVIRFIFEALPQNIIKKNKPLELEKISED